MSIRAEHVLIRLLIDLPSLAYLAAEGLNTELLPTAELHDVLNYALAYYTQSGRAPTDDVLRERFGDRLNDNDIDIDDPPNETVEWAIVELTSSFIKRRTKNFATDLGAAIMEATPEEQPDVLAQKLAELSDINQAVTPRRTQVDLRESGDAILREYQQAAETDGEPRGLRFGLEQIDRYTHGIHPGELAVLAAPTKTGKSWLAAWIAYCEWKAGRRAGLFTLENSIEMTRLRIGCIALHLPIDQLMRGTLPPEDLATLESWVNDELVKSETPLRIFHPSPAMRTAQAIMQQATAVGCESLLIDQLTFMEVTRNPYQRTEKQTEEVGRIMHDLKSLISTGRHPIPCLLVHQINREGTRRVQASGRLDMSDLANSSEVERTADWVFGLYATRVEHVVSRMALQTLASRRVKPKDFDLIWRIDVGRISVTGERPAA